MRRFIHIFVTLIFHPGLASKHKLIKNLIYASDLLGPDFMAVTVGLFSLLFWENVNISETKDD